MEVVQDGGSHGMLNIYIDGDVLIIIVYITDIETRVVLSQFHDVWKFLAAWKQVVEISDSTSSLSFSYHSNIRKYNKHVSVNRNQFIDMITSCWKKTEKSLKKFFKFLNFEIFTIDEVIVTSEFVAIAPEL